MRRTKIYSYEQMFVIPLFVETCDYEMDTLHDVHYAVVILVELFYNDLKLCFVSYLYHRNFLICLFCLPLRTSRMT